MTVRELINLLEDHDAHAEVRIAHQPSWPFEYSIGDIVACDPGDEDEEGECGDGGDASRGHEPPVVYIGEREQLGYLPGSACRALGWK